MASEEKLPFIKNALCSPNLPSDNPSSAKVPRVRFCQFKSLVNSCLVKLKVVAKRVYEKGIMDTPKDGEGDFYFEDFIAYKE